jgi:hypothetical protein
VAHFMHPSVRMPRETRNCTNHETRLVVSVYEVVVLNTDDLLRVMYLEVSTFHVQIIVYVCFMWL